MFNCLGLLCGNIAVLELDYVLVTLIKAPKSLSIVFISVVTGLFNKSKAKTIELETIINVVIFTVGLILFNYSVMDQSNLQSDSSFTYEKTSMKGVIVCCFATFFDSLSGYFQIDERKKYSPSPFMFMFTISFHTCYATFIGGKEIPDFFSFSYWRTYEGL